MATVFVVGAGPAGLFTAQKIALEGHETVIFNRDIKPGGLAEYGIYPLKHKMKHGLRKQFDKVFSLPNVHYFGHVPVGSALPVSIDALREFSPDAMVFAVGAQGTKKLALPGGDARCVYSAKDFVYHYNQLPPFATQDFSLGKRVAVIGMGNVMVDIARWLLRDDPNHVAEQVIVIARRGPFEAKFDEKEFNNIEMYLDRKAFQDELQRINAALAAVGQDLSKVPDEAFSCLLKSPERRSVLPRLTFRFLSSPLGVIAGRDGRIARLLISENQLVNRNENIVAESTDETAELDVDAMIFAIGDMHDSSLGLPFGPNGYVTNPDKTDPNAKYEVFDPATEKFLEKTYVVGWARKPSEGLVGIARHDGESGATHVLKYLDSLGLTCHVEPSDIESFLERRGVQFVPKSDLPWLQAAEQREAQVRNITGYKFSDDAAMLLAIEQEKTRPVPTVSEGSMVSLS